MKPQARVVVYGRSLHMAAIATSLKAETHLDVFYVDPLVPGARETVAELEPAVVVFDLGRGLPGLDVTLLCEQLGLLLIGADPNRDELLILPYFSKHALSMADLADIIRQTGDIMPADWPKVKRAKKKIRM